MNKKFLSKIIVVALTLLSLVGLLPSSVYAASSSLSAPSTIQKGSNFTVAFSVSGSAMEGIDATIKYDSSKIQYVGASKTMPNPWNTTIDVSSGTIRVLTIDDSLSKPLSSARICNVTFKAIGAVSDSFSISLSGKTSNASGTSSAFSSSSLSRKIASPPSSNANLASLSVSNAKISPSFSSSTLTYSAKVGFDVSALSVSAKAADSGAKVSVSGNSLKAGETTNVYVVVKAPSGAKKTYTIKVARDNDPNYVASNVNDLSMITVENALLSPQFISSKTNYVVYVPYEVDNLTIKATAVNPKALMTLQGNENLEVGDNDVKVICKAENGDEKVYNILVVKADDFENPTLTNKDDIKKEDDRSFFAKMFDTIYRASLANIVVFIILFILGLLIGIIIFMIANLSSKKKREKRIKKRKADKEASENNQNNES